MGSNEFKYKYMKIQVGKERRKKRKKQPLSWESFFYYALQSFWYLN